MRVDISFSICHALKVFDKLSERARCLLYIASRSASFQMLKYESMEGFLNLKITFLLENDSFSLLGKVENGKANGRNTTVNHMI